MMESRLHHDFSHVRIHDGPAAAASARALGASAFTLGRDIFFGAGLYRPDSHEGRSLLAHELVHVVQQGEAGPRRSATSGSAAGAEREARSIASRVAAGRSAGTIAHSLASGTVQRQPADPDPQPAPAQTAPVASWDPARTGTFSIMVDSAKATPGSCFGEASSGATANPLSACGHLEHFCTTRASYPVRIRFYVDAVNIPRPAPFRPPEVRAALEFVPDGASAATFSRTVSDTNPRYSGPGRWLEPNFGTTISITASGGGQLTADLQLFDRTHDVRVGYVDTVRCHLAPCA